MVTALYIKDNGNDNENTQPSSTWFKIMYDSFRMERKLIVEVWYRELSFDCESIRTNLPENSQIYEQVSDAQSINVVLLL